MENEKNALDRIKSAIIDFYNDPLYQELNAYYSKKTIFNILKIERNENRHSAFLAWLLDTNGSHGLGDEPLKRFMRLLAKIDESDRYYEPFMVGNYQIENVKIDTEHPASIGSGKMIKKGRIDIFIEFDYKGENGPNHVHIIVENKVYTNEHDNQTKLYHDWAKQEFKNERNRIIIGVFLAPENSGNCSADTKDFSYVKITYQDILQDLIEPLLKLEMQPEARIFIMDYVINLGQPVKDEENAAKFDNQDTILAISKDNQEKFIQLYNRNTKLLDAALYSKCYERCPKQLRTVFSDYEKFKDYSKDNLLIFETFWNSNSDLLRMILDTVLTNGVKEIASKKGIKEETVLDAISVLLELNERDRYLVYVDGALVDDNKNPYPKSIASLYIFKAWLKKHKKATIDDIRKAFPVEKCTKNKKYPYQYLFYTKDHIMNALKNNKEKGRTYYVAPMDEDKESSTQNAHKYLTWDFFIDDDDKHCLEIHNEKVLSMKMWLKDEFSLLVECAEKQHYGIVVKGQ